MSVLSFLFPSFFDIDNENELALGLGALQLKIAANFRANTNLAPDKCPTKFIGSNCTIVLACPKSWSCKNWYF